jgi:hypothetical protein
LLDATFFREAVTYTKVWPLPGLRIADAPLELSPGILVDYMDSDEVIAALKQNILYYGESLTFIEPPLCLRFRARVPKRLSDDFHDSSDDAINTEGILERFYQAWRLMSSQRLEHAGYLSYAHLGPPRHINGEGRTLDHKVHREIVLNDSRRFQTFWEAVASPPVQKRLGIAIRRFSTSIEREEVGDRLVDLLVGSETLFLSDVDERTELSYRLSMRAAASSSVPDRTKSFRFFKAAYKVRSRLVHGEQPQVKDMWLPDGSRTDDLVAFTDAVEDALRDALAGVVLQLHGGGSMPDWDAAVLGVRPQL